MFSERPYERLGYAEQSGQGYEHTQVDTSKLAETRARPASRRSWRRSVLWEIGDWA